MAGKVRAIRIIEVPRKYDKYEENIYGQRNWQENMGRVRKIWSVAVKYGTWQENMVSGIKIWQVVGKDRVLEM